MSPSEEQTRAAELVQRYGRSSNDFFKLWPDKRYFFSQSGQGCVAYGVDHGVAIALGDPAASNLEMAATVREFAEYCGQQRWLPVFHQVLPDFLDVYRALNFRSFKASEEAIVDLATFTTSGRDGKPLRNTLNAMYKAGIHAEFFDAPAPDQVIEQAHAVSNSWLATGRRERKFVLGQFSPEYARSTPLLAAFDSQNVMQGFVNIIPAYAPETATIDMMRHRDEAPHGLMDFLFLQLFDHNRAQGFRYFSLGPAPILELPSNETASFEEKAFYRLAHHLDGFFSMSGLRQYKAKFATIWEPRYLIHRRTADWPRVLRAFTNLTELDENRQPLLGRENRREFRKMTVEAIGEIRRARKDRHAAKQATKQSAA